jgi:hypothetical protein
MAEVIRPCTEQGPGEILEVINYAAQAYKGVIGGSPPPVPRAARRCAPLRPGNIRARCWRGTGSTEKERPRRVVKLRSDSARVEFGAPPG